MKPCVWILAAALLGFLPGCGGDITASSSTAGPRPLSGKLVLTGSGTVAPLAMEIAQRFSEQHPEVRIDIQTGGSSRGIADTLSGTAHIGMASRALKPEEHEQDLVEHRIAVDGICLIVHQDNPLRSLEKEQITAIYTGQIENWNAVGGLAGEIVVVHKAAGRATQEVFLEYLQLENSSIQADVIGGDNQQVIQTVAGNPAAIGYVSIGEAAAEVAHGTAIALVAADTVQPSAEQVADGSYPIVRPLNFITYGKPNPLAQQFLEFAQSPQVHDLVEQQGFVASGG